ncbi:MAG: vtpJ-therm [Alphaproteobacteria bacterium]|nr:vtpJ-therm [Alphaproteobacteria bacterium]
MRTSLPAVSVLLCVLAGCTAPSSGVDLSGEAARLGLDAYLGQAVAEGTQTEGGVTTTTFTVDSGPLCMRGDPFRAATREGSGDALLVFLQGGGACWTEFCLAVTKAPVGMPGVDVLNPDLPGNPFADYDVAYAPYCDGSLFSGDADVDEDDDGTIDRYHRGLANLSATLDLAAAAFPNPSKVVLAGSSGGAYGTILGTVLVRAVFPDVELVVLADSGTGVARGPDDPAYVQGLLEEQGSLKFVPPECPDCVADGHVTGILDWWMAKDPDVRVGVFSSWYDSIIGDVFLQIPPPSFRDLLAEATGALHDAYPDRYRRFLVDGRMHTTLLGDPTGIIGSDLGAVELPPNALSLLTDLEIGHLATTQTEGVAFTTWAQALLDGDTAAWVDVQAVPGAPPTDE